MTLAQRMRQIRQLRNLTQEQLAEKTGIPNTYLSLMESGKVTPAGDWETRIREALNWTPDVDAKLDALHEENPT